MRYTCLFMISGMRLLNPILDSLSTAVSNLSSSLYFMGMQNMFAVIMLRHILFNFFVSNFVQFLSHHALSELLTKDDQKVWALCLH